MGVEPKKLYHNAAIAFTDEEGVGNGPFREAFAIFSQALFSADSPLFEPTPDGTAWHLKRHLSPEMATQAPLLYEAVGRTLAMSFSRELPLNARLSLPLLKRCLGAKLGWSDIRHFDQKLHATLHAVVSKRQTPEYWAALEQAFVITVDDADGAKREVPLMAEGETTLVTEKNK